MLITKQNRDKYTLTISNHIKPYQEIAPNGYCPLDSERYTERHVNIPYQDIPQLTFKSESASRARSHYKVVVTTNTEDVETHIVSSGDSTSAPFTFGRGLITRFGVIEMFMSGSTIRSRTFRHGNDHGYGVITVRVYRLVFARLHPVPIHLPMQDVSFNQQVDGSQLLEDQLDLDYGVTVNSLDCPHSPSATFRFFCFLLPHS
ncbi:hypothetical protein QCA50_019671 [Cerrena zonata]|uniref:Uncharacterized protein n=1 Tax=Cerrena zonata TaxID=2478898 RepID=A0AAW0FJ11_9APHY